MPSGVPTTPILTLLVVGSGADAGWIDHRRRSSTDGGRSATRRAERHAGRSTTVYGQDVVARRRSPRASTTAKPAPLGPAALFVRAGGPPPGRRGCAR